LRRTDSRFDNIEFRLEGVGGVILSILFAVLGYRKAKKTGRNKILWALILGLLFIAVQLGVFAIGVIGALSWGWDPALFDTYYWPINLSGWLLGIAICSLALYLLGRGGNPQIEVPEAEKESDLVSDSHAAG